MWTSGQQYTARFSCKPVVTPSTMGWYIKCTTVGINMYAIHCHHIVCFRNLIHTFTEMLGWILLLQTKVTETCPECRLFYWVCPEGETLRPTLTESWSTTSMDPLILLPSLNSLKDTMGWTTWSCDQVHIIASLSCSTKLQILYIGEGTRRRSFLQVRAPTPWP